MCGHSLILQQISQCLRVIQCIALVGTLTGTEDQAVLLSLGQRRLVGNAVLLQIGKGVLRAAVRRERGREKDESQLKLDPPADAKPDGPDYDAFQGVKFSE